MSADFTRYHFCGIGNDDGYVYFNNEDDTKSLAYDAVKKVLYVGSMAAYPIGLKYYLCGVELDVDTKILEFMQSAGSYKFRWNSRIEQEIHPTSVMVITPW